ncbi:MAG: hypothetical protein WDO74_23140 [Pseudomonadota bacterium]
MGKSIARRVGAIIALGLLLAACSGSEQKPEGSFGNVGGSSGSVGSSDNGGSPSVCVVGSKRCDGLNIKVCDETRTERIAQTCSASQSCANGACVGSTCVPNTKFCQDGAVWKCDDSGTSTRDQQCSVGLFCRADGDDASCSSQACAPSQPVCNREVATICETDGSGPISGGADCSKSKRACYGGQCRDIACSNGTKLCQHGDVYVCSQNGTDFSLLADCRTGEVCDGDMGSCRAQLCDPGKVSCDGTRVQTCNAFGSAWLPGALDCAEDGKICVSGSCKKQICSANRSYCQDGNLYGCDSTGTGSTLKASCRADTEHCTTYNSGSSGYCEPNACHAGDKLCVDNMIKVCNADGSLPASGTPCGDTQYCENAQCKERGCVPGAYFCKGADVYYCDFSGPYLQEQCVAETACKPLGTSGAACTPLACSPSSSACVGNQIGICSTDGQSLSQVTEDCTATTNVCTADLKCAKSVTDAVGVDESVEPIYGGNLLGDVIDVDSSRKLTELQTRLVFAGVRELRWIVYELSGQTFVAKVDKVVSSSAGTGFIASGPLSFQLTAGKRYLLAVVVSGGDAVDYIDGYPFAANVSFGTVVGRVVSYYPGSFDIFSIDRGYVTQMKMTTESP